MNTKFMREKGFNDWYENLEGHSLMGSDDFDSWSSTYYLRSKFGCEMDFFFNFADIYKRADLNTSTMTRKNVVGIDIDLAKGYKCFSNHPTYVQNKNTISLNRGIPYGCNDYFKKFAGSTLITIMSLYNEDISHLTTEQLEVLISIDSGFKQYSFNKDLFKYYYEEVLEYPIFVDIVKDRDNDYFYDIIKKYKLNGKIWLNDDGYLQTNIKLDELSDLFGIDLSLPTDKYIYEFGMQSVGMPLYQFKRTVKEEDIFSSAVTNKNFVKATVKF